MPTKLGRPLSKRLEVKDAIRESIRVECLWGRKLANDRELARQLKASRRTVQTALGELQAEGLLVRRQGAGTFVVERSAAKSRRKHAQVAVITARPRHLLPGWDYGGEMIRGAQGLSARLKTECSVLSFDRSEDAERLSDRKWLRRFDAFILVSLVPSTIDREFISHLLKLPKRPVVLLDDTVRDLPLTSVVDGSFEGMRAVTRHLLHLGHRRVAFLDCHNRDGTNPEKFAGYRAALSEKGIACDEELVDVPPESFPVRPYPDAPELSEYVDTAVERLLALEKRPTAIVGFSDHWAMPAADALQKRGKRVGVDIAVAGHGDSAHRRGTCDWLTSCRIYPRKMGEAAVRAALEPGSREESRTIIVRNRLYVRRSSCPPPEERTATDT